MSHVEPIQLAQDVYYLQVGPSLVNAGFVVTTDGVVVVDSGPTPAAGAAIRAAIARVTDQPIAYVVNTHFHSSHTFGNQAFDVPVIAHSACREQMQRALTDEWSREEIERCCAEHREIAPEMEGFRLTMPSISFAGAGFLHIGGKLVHLVHLGNHTPDSIAVFLPEQRVLFAGDNLFNGRHPFLRHANAGQWVDLLRRLESLKFDNAIPGHGRAMERKDVYNLRVYFESLLRAPRLRKGQPHLERIAQV